MKEAKQKPVIAITRLGMGAMPRLPPPASSCSFLESKINTSFGCSPTALRPFVLVLVLAFPYSINTYCTACYARKSSTQYEQARFAHFLEPAGMIFPFGSSSRLFTRRFNRRFTRRFTRRALQILIFLYFISH